MRTLCTVKEAHNSVFNTLTARHFGLSYDEDVLFYYFITKSKRGNTVPLRDSFRKHENSIKRLIFQRHVFCSKNHKLTLNDSYWRFSASMPAAI